MRRLLNPVALLSVLVLLVTLVAVIWPALLAPYDPLDSVGTARLESPSWDHLFGTDALARDVFSRVVYGARLSLLAAVLATTAGAALGALIGLISGTAGGRVDFAVMRVVDVMLAIPGILLALIVVASLGFGAVSIAIGVGLGATGSFARVMRAQVMRIRNEEYIEAARTMGLRRPTILLRHVLPNASQPIVAMASTELALAILAVSALSFLGFGAQPPTPEWGSLVADGRQFIATAPWLSIMPGSVILVVVLAVNGVARNLGGNR